MSQRSVAVAARLFQDRPERVNQAGQPEEKAQHNIDERGLHIVGLEVDRQRRDEDGEDDEQWFVHGRERSAGNGVGNGENSFCGARK
jgi:hypothetical protein